MAKNQSEFGNRLIRTILCICTLLSSAEPAVADHNPASISSAINRWICWRNFRIGNQTFELGSTSSIEVNQLGTTAYASIVSSSQTKMTPSWGGFGMVNEGGDQYNVVNYFNGDLGDEYFKYIFEKSHGAVRSRIYTTFEKLIVPADCTPHTEVFTRQRSLMFHRILSSLSEYFVAFNERRPNTYPKHLDIIVSDFNTNDPATYILIPVTHEILVISFSGNYEGSAWSPGDSGYMVTQFLPSFGTTGNITYLNRMYNQLIEKIMKHGVHARIDTL